MDWFTDGLVEWFKVENNGKDWDQHLSYVLFAYRSTQQDRVLSIYYMEETHIYQLMKHLAFSQIKG